jgi:hypothetical protein
MMEPLQTDMQALQLSMEQDEIDAKSIAEKQANLEQRQQQQQAADEAAEPKDKPSVAGEVYNAVVGGVAESVEDIVTLPERVIDIASGEASEENYRPDTAFLGEDAFETKTWWGGALKGLVNAGTMFIPVGGLAKGLGIGAKIGTAAAKGSKIAKAINNPLAKGAIKGAGVDLVLQTSQGDNASAAVRDHFGWIDTPLATKDTDHPAMKTFKNVVEGMGIGAALDGLLFVIKGAGAADEVLKRNDNIKTQTIEKGKQAAPDADFDPYRDKAVANRTQGNPQSTGAPSAVTKQLDQIDSTMGGEYLSTDPVLTTREVDRMSTGSGESTKVIRDITEKLVKEDPNLAKQLNEVRQGRKKLSDINSDAVRRFQGIVGNPRDLEALDVDDMLRNAPKDVIDGVEIIDPETVMVYDMVIGSLAKQVRDYGIATREVKNYTDITEQGGVVDSLKGKLSALMVATKRARYMSSLNLKRYDVGGVKKAEVKKGLKEIEDTTRDKIEQMFSIFEEDPNGELFEAVIEAFSMSNKIHNITDFDNFMRSKLSGGDFGGKPDTGILTKELGNVMVHSILSGPKTPVRAVLGTSVAGSTRMISQTLGALIRAPMTGDIATLKSSAASMGAMVGAIPEAFKVFKTKLNGYWSGEIATASTRFAEKNLRDENWVAYGQWANSRGTAGDKAAYNIADVARKMNDNNLFTYSTKLMAATDDAWRVVMARTRAKEQAIRFVLDQKKNGVVLDAADARAAEDGFYKGLLDDEGNIDLNSDLYLKSMYKEATLTEDLSGFAEGLNNAFEKAPHLKPFFLFARTGVNGLALTGKNTPIIGALMTKQRKILSAKTAADLAELRKYGIRTMEELANEKSLIVGRQAIGTAVVFMGAQMYLNGNLRGNGPVNRQQRKVWTDAGWRRSEIKLGDVWVNFDSLEPWSQVLNTIADIGDAYGTMGEDWTENQFKMLTGIIAEGITSKSYLQGLQQLVDLASGEPYQFQKIIGNLGNNTVPLAGLRNEIGKVINPQMRELSSSIFDAVRNRNLLSESLTSDPLPMRYDILSGKPIRDWDAPTRLWNAFSPIPMNFDEGPGRQLLFNSNYDMSTSFNSMEGINLRDKPKVRSEFQRLIGEQNLEKELNKLAARPDIKRSVAAMQADAAKGNRDVDPMKVYPHLPIIRELFNKAKKKAWAQLKQTPEVKQMITDRNVQRGGQYKTRSTLLEQVQPLISYPNK